MAVRRRELFNGGAGFLAGAALSAAASPLPARTSDQNILASEANEFATLIEARSGQLGQRSFVRTAGLMKAGDGGAALYRRAVGEPEHSGKFRDAGGTWFEYVPGPEGVSAAAFGVLAGHDDRHGAGLQAAIDFAHRAGGGKVLIDAGTYFLGPEGLRLRENIILQGAVGRYAGDSSKGCTLRYGGRSAAVHGQNIVDAQIRDIDIDCSGAVGTEVRGLSLSGCWKTSLKNLTVRGVPPEKGVAILLDTNPDGLGPGQPWGAQHNYLEQVECADGVMAILGRSSNDGVTTTVCNTVRGYQYVVVSSQVVFINSTAEGWVSGSGFDFRGPGCVGLMLGCDIEGAGAVGIKVAADAEVRETGTIWYGFSGDRRVDGRFASLRSYGAPMEFVGELAAGVAQKTFAAGDRHVSNFVEDWVVPEAVVGGSQSGYRVQRRLIGGRSYVDHNWRDHALLRQEFSTSGSGFQTLMRVEMPNGGGAELRALAVGSQAGAGLFLIRRSARVLNDGGRILLDEDAQVRIEGEQRAAGEVQFIIEGQAVLVKLRPASAARSSGTLNVEILGAFGGWS